MYILTHMNRVGGGFSPERTCRLTLNNSRLFTLQSMIKANFNLPSDIRLKVITEPFRSSTDHLHFIIYLNTVGRGFSPERGCL
jgi:hypothetical protein